MVVRCRAGLFAALLAVGAAGCGSSSSGSDAAKDTLSDVGGDAPRDVTPDAPRDVTPDAPADAAPDGGPLADAGSDGGPLADAGSDGGLLPDASPLPDAASDAPPLPDAALDAPPLPDALPDDAATSDASADASVDAPSDAAPDPFAGYRWLALPEPLGTPITAITMDSEGTLYAGAGIDYSRTAPSAGILKSTDEGASWRAVNRGVYDFRVGALAAVGTTIYAGTGGLLRSVDRGATWQQLTYPDSVAAMSIIGAQGDLVMTASSSSGNYLSTDGGKTFTISRVSNVISIDVLAAGAVIVVGNNTGVLRSTDRGATFNPVPGILSGSGFGAQVRCDGASTCYAIARTTSNTSDPLGLLKSTDAGATWAATAAPAAIGYVLAISDTGSVYVTSGTMIARSDDGGATFTLVHRPTTAGAFEPNCNGPYVARGDKLFAACPDGVYRSSDKGQHWQPARGTPATGPITGLAERMFVDTTPTALGPSGDIYVIAREDLGPSRLRRSSDGGWTWQTMVRPFSAGPCLVTSGGALECLSVTGFGRDTLALARSDDHGATWRSIALPPGSAPSGPFTAATLARAGSLVYAGGNGVARSTDDGLTFQILAGSPTAVGLQVLRSGHLLARDSYSSDGYRSTDQGATWQPITRLYGLPVVEDAAGRLIRYTGASNFEVSTDEGSTWPSQASDGLPLVIGTNVPMTIDGAGNLFAFGPGPATSGSADRTSGLPLRVVASADGGRRFTPMPDQIPNPNVTAFATDKQGRLIVATTGGVFRLESQADPGPSRPDGGVGGASDGGSGGPAPRPLTMVLENAPWKPTPSHPAFSADTNQRLYRMEQSTIYAVDGATVTPYLTLSEAVTGAGLSNGAWFTDFDIGPDGQLYVMMLGTPVGSSTSSDLVVRSSGAHQAALWRLLPTTIASSMGVLGEGRIGVVDRNGFTTFTASGGQTVYGPSLLESTDGCANQDLATGASGVFLYLPGCLGSGVLRGNADGSGLGLLYPTGYSAADAGGFSCAARDPAGGFYLMATGTGLGTNEPSPRLYHIAESGSSVASLVHVVTEPSFGEARLARGGASGTQFARCSMAVAPNGVIYVQTLKEVWKVGL